MNYAQYEREEDSIDAELAEGLITRDEHRKLIRDLRRDFEEAAHEQAQDAYDNVMDNLGY